MTHFVNDEVEAEYDKLVDGKNPITVIKQLAENYNDTCYDIGCILYTMKFTDIYKTIDGKKYYSDNHTKWKAFCEDNLSISYRTAQYWLNLYRYFVSEMGMSKAQLKELGWHKAKELIDVTDDSDVLSDTLKRANDMNVAEVTAYAEAIRRTGDANVDVPRFVDFKFRLPATQGTHINEILNTASVQCNGDKSEAFFMVVLEWFQDRHPVSEEDRNTYLVSEDTLDNNGQELPKDIMELLG